MSGPEFIAGLYAKISRETGDGTCFAKRSVRALGNRNYKEAISEAEGAAVRDKRWGIFLDVVRSFVASQVAS